MPRVVGCIPLTLLSALDIAAQVTPEVPMVGQFEQTILALMIFVIMFGMGASLTVKDFVQTFKRPYGMVIGLVSQYGFLPLIAFVLAVTLPVAPEIKVGLLIMGCMPGGTTSNIFTYFAKGNLALSVMMTVNSTVFGVVMIPFLIVSYIALMQAFGVTIVVPAENIIITLILLLLPVALGMAVRKWNANVGAVCEVLGSLLGIVFILLLMVTWVPRNWQFLMSTGWATYACVIGLGVFGFFFGYTFSKLLKLHNINAQTIAMEIGIQNGPLAIAVVTFAFAAQPDMQQAVMAVPALYSLFIVITATIMTVWFRHVNDRSQQKMPDGLL
jgi:BASS family bile acid:Na+ symporter